MKRQILIWPNRQLLKSSRQLLPDEVPAFQTVIDDMLETMVAARGVGMSAVQIGVPIRLVVMSTIGPGWEKILINPEVTPMGSPEWGNEGCLSFPGIFDDILRSPQVLVKYLDRNGQPQTGDFRGLEARIIQHEVEHLDGVTLPDHLQYHRRGAIKATLQQLARTALRSGKTTSQLVYGW